MTKKKIMMRGVLGEGGYLVGSRGAPERSVVGESECNDMYPRWGRGGNSSNTRSGGGEFVSLGTLLGTFVFFLLKPTLG